MRAAIALDPGLMAELLKKARARANIAGGRHRDGSAYVTGRNLAAEDAAGVLGNVAHFAELAVEDGDPRSIGQLMSIAFSGFGTGDWRWLTDEEILEAYRATRPHGDEPPPDAGAGPDDGDGPDEEGPGPMARLRTPRPRPRRVTPAPSPARRGNAGGCAATASTCASSCPPCSAATAPRRPRPLRVHRRNRRARPRRRALRRRWCFALVDDAGYLLAAGPIRGRPHGWARRERRDRSHVDLLIPARLLREMLQEQPDPAWAHVLTEIATTAEAALNRPAPDPTRRFAGAELRRLILVRSATCIWGTAGNPPAPARPTTPTNTAEAAPPTPATSGRCAAPTTP